MKTDQLYLILGCAFLIAAVYHPHKTDFYELAFLAILCFIISIINPIEKKPRACTAEQCSGDHDAHE